MLSNNERNVSNIVSITDSITTIAATSEEIFSAVTNVQDQMGRLREECVSLNEQSDMLGTVSEDLKVNMRPVSTIEKDLDDSAKLMGNMVEDVFYMLSNRQFIANVQNAITAHQNWLKTLGTMVKDRECVPLQTDDTKCAFGHFYYAMTPDIPGVLPIWERLGPKHQKFHRYGASVIDAINSGDYMEAERIYHEAENYSKDLISDMEEILRIANT